MRKLLVKGCEGLNGEVSVSGSKNSALPILAATILTEGQTTLSSIPNLLDVMTMLKVLRALSIRAEYYHPNQVKIWVGSRVKHVAPYQLVTRMRASFFVIGPILAKMGFAKVPLPGGCAIGSRPVDIHIKGLERLGAKVRMEHGFVVAEAEKLKGEAVHLDFPSVGATETIMMAATLAIGETTINNAAREPEIVDLANFLNKAGAQITGAGSEEIKIEGVKRLTGVNHRIIPDRIEAGTFMAAAAACGGAVTIKEVIPQQLEVAILKMKEAGVEVVTGEDFVTVKSQGRVKAIDLSTLPHPGFPTDLQPQFCSMLCRAEGVSVVKETVFESRFTHLNELKRMGADIKIEGRSAIIKGVERLSSAPVVVSDLRAGAGLVIAALSAVGETLIDDRDRQIERGYENILKKFGGLGADIKVVDEREDQGIPAPHLQGA
ncbi:UDP-N-acetylglucosamine 1-carboxyvinyltransferase [candidate division WOR-1 bacterium RIFOXYA12_FULL_43_27]|uniref:UDP-N-acetylglucosamine 1-carboxyvinyltransferase n=1 Tax=candidate division WOR-1 bacterium RIFOXYC2_FULL_46_14 TaxID=1802587 RepID=A0A1F4U7T1_UNCSA|nr:MAG: UDP-N-acetylglucosamine 1-carboxyvinyltransferase [candidate division WOR-1 bacterium RIFOXYA12_FULL_43_27]OGC19425.1 MAG: UDP-N-acetylglucosamine 1-carboxyvinyltransferase [candidate division WOR-1 bacterium RIFOXYB2_FULL_46_45]OGC30414.1 MAG: UDP-N-acetylglucosamine 1-carboxyvinyltransferase [candidate division WOR-1 bacterium RIFOXYA2_FULL_46_56]OGC41014.1 MAG: UDP-N-acetylglucosamine 1-carboxyvinyltransferase [candidate division WOR-1 bacterium RIFOXYC2_FULL_46_14]